uniref:Reverse transcriptase domain-containing protein n=1 Tax=Tanacetum cinerariifolium TaxID=118510 RepID=A0A699I2V4_TANCI|nr:reverse transcriptase domain-containing protein [Tanacetum cinerariifolium]
MSSSSYPFIVPSDSNIDDAFSSTNTPDYTLASPDYFSAPLGNTSLDPLNDLTKGLLAVLAFSPFHDDSHMKEILPPKKQAHGRSSSSTSALPQVFEIKESSRVTRLERHKEQIKEILNHLDELSLDHIEHIEDKIKGLGNGQVIIQQDYDKMETNSKKIVLRFLDFRENKWDMTMRLFTLVNCAEENKVTFATGTLTDDALSWWNAYAQPIGIEQANKITWTELKKLLTNKYCPRTEVKKMEDEFYSLTVKGNDLKTYGISLKYLRDRYCLKASNIRGTNIAQRLIDQIIKHGPCTIKCHTCNKVGYLTRNCRNKGPATESNLQPVSVTCHAYREKGHYNYQCSKANNNAYGRTYLLRDKNTHRDLNVVTGLHPDLLNQPFEIDFMAIKLGFKVVIGMDWLSRGCQVFLAKVMEKKSNERRLEDIQVVREFLKVFPEDLPGLPPVRQIEFQIDLIPGAALVS